MAGLSKEAHIFQNVSEYNRRLLQNCIDLIRYRLLLEGKRPSSPFNLIPNPQMASIFSSPTQQQQTAFSSIITSPQLEHL